MCTFCIRNIDCNLLNQHNNCLQKLYKVYFFVDFLKVLRFSFPVPVVGPSAKTFIPCRAPISLPEVLSNHERFYWCAVNQTRSCHMKRDLNCFELCIFLRAVFWISFYRLYLLKYKAFVGFLSSSIWVLYQGQIFLAATERENITYLYCFERALQSFILIILIILLLIIIITIYVFFPGVYKPYVLELHWWRARPKSLETEFTNITRRPFC